MLADRSVVVRHQTIRTRWPRSYSGIFWLHICTMGRMEEVCANKFNSRSSVVFLAVMSKIALAVTAATAGVAKSTRTEIS